MKSPFSHMSRQDPNFHFQLMWVTAWNSVKEELEDNLFAYFVWEEIRYSVQYLRDDLTH